MVQIKITRLKEWANRRFPYQIIVNDKEQFELGNGEGKNIVIEQASTIQAKIMWCGSAKIKIHNSNANIKEVRIKANKRINVVYPFGVLLTIFLVSIINLIFPENGAKDFMIGMLVVLIIFLIGLLTIWRDKFLDIELVRE
ncbi:MAG: hypothetical protein MUF68_07940 [Cyclobacteriaceae bacterium]|jgi:hypothetical protein|nr:hypothetical protein [Cyclobacteriaceae bacterium]